MFIRGILMVLSRAAVKLFGAATILKFANATSLNIHSEVKKAVFRKAAAECGNENHALPDVEFIIFYGDTSAESHFAMWDPVFSQIEGRCKSVLRYAEPWWDIANRSDVLPVASLRQTELAYSRMPNLKAIFYPANNGVNLQSVRHTQYSHIFLGHGDSDKASSASKVFRLFDEVWVAGQAHIDRFDNIKGDFSALDFRVVAQPWMSNWLAARPAYQLEDQTDWGYFPTWSGYYGDSNYSSLAAFEKIAKTLQGFGEGWVKPHPRTNLTAVSELNDLVTVQENLTLMPPHKQIRDALSKPLRFVICDISAATTECLFINVPIFLFKPGLPAKLSSDFASIYSYCYVFSTVDELETLIERVITNKNDYLAAQRADALSYMVDVEKMQTNQFATELDRLSQG